MRIQSGLVFLVSSADVINVDWMRIWCASNAQCGQAFIADDHDSSDFDSEVHPPKKAAATFSAGAIKMQAYKTKLTYNASRKMIHPWMNYDSHLKGMVCTVCKDYGKVSVQAKGA